MGQSVQVEPRHSGFVEARPADRPTGRPAGFVSFQQVTLQYLYSAVGPIPMPADRWVPKRDLGRGHSSLAVGSSRRGDHGGAIYFDLYFRVCVEVA